MSDLIKHPSVFKLEYPSYATRMAGTPLLSLTQPALASATPGPLLPPARDASA